MNWYDLVRYWLNTGINGLRTIGMIGFSLSFFVIALSLTKGVSYEMLVGLGIFLWILLFFVSLMIWIRPIIAAKVAAAGGVPHTGTVQTNAGKFVLVTMTPVIGALWAWGIDLKHHHWLLIPLGIAVMMWLSSVVFPARSSWRRGLVLLGLATLLGASLASLLSDEESWLSGMLPEESSSIETSSPGIVVSATVNVNQQGSTTTAAPSVQNRAPKVNSVSPVGNTHRACQGGLAEVTLVADAYDPDGDNFFVFWDDRSTGIVDYEGMEIKIFLPPGEHVFLTWGEDEHGLRPSNAVRTTLYVEPCS